jgi:hypothetical protein
MLSHRTQFVAGTVISLLLLAGCQDSSMPAAAQATGTSHRAVVSSAGNGGSSTIFLESADPNNPVIYCSNGTDVCPECKAAAIKYFQTGVLDPKCSKTGATRTTIVEVPTNIGHQ